MASANVDPPSSDSADTPALAAADGPHLRACHCCGLVQELPPVPQGHLARCSRCESVVWRRRRPWRTNSWAAAATWTALIFYPFGITLPVVRLEQLGETNEASIWSGAVSLLGHGDILVGVIVLTCSIVIPLVKLTGLFILTSRRSILSRRDRASFYRLLELIGRWGMVDVLLVALMVAFIKLGDVAEMSPGPGVLAFTLSVGFSLIATAAFDPHALWESE